MNGAYIKFVLTAIAIGLFWIGVNTTAQVSAGPDIMNVNIQQIGGAQVGSHYAKAIKVEVTGK